MGYGPASSMVIRAATAILRSCSGPLSMFAGPATRGVGLNQHRAAAINRTMSKTAGKIPCQKSQGRPMAKPDDDLTANSRRGEKEERQSERRSCYLRLLVQTNMFSRWVRDAKRNARALLGARDGSQKGGRRCSMEKKKLIRKNGPYKINPKLGLAPVNNNLFGYAPFGLRAARFAISRSTRDRALCSRSRSTTYSGKTPSAP